VVRLVTTNRGLFLGARPGCRTTSALMMTRRLRVHFLAAYRVSPYRWAVSPVWRESTRARPISRRARFSKRRLLAIATTYSTSWRSRNVNNLALAKPPSRRTRNVAPGKAARSLRSRDRRIPRAPKPAGAGAQHRGHRELHGFVVERHGGDQRQIAPGVVVAVEERKLLLAVGGVVGGIQIDRDPPDAPVQAPPLLRDHGVGQHVRHGAQFSRAHGVLESRQRGLRGQAEPGEGIAAQHQLVDRVVDQPGGVVAVGVAPAQPEDALLEQLDRLVQDLARRPRIVEAGGQPLRQTQLGIQGLDQDQAAVGAYVWQVEAGDDRLRKAVALEGHLRYTVCSHRASSRRCVEASRHRFHSTYAWLGGSSLSSFANFPG